MVLSIGFRSSVSFLSAIQATGLLTFAPVGLSPTEHASLAGRAETKFLRLRTPVTLGSRFGDWRVCWLGGWTKHRFAFIVMVVRDGPESLEKSLACGGVQSDESWWRSTPRQKENDSNMNVFTITAKNEVRRFTSGQEIPPGGVVFGSAEELAAAVGPWPTARLVEVWNQVPGAKPLTKFTDRKTAVRRLWEALAARMPDSGQQRRKVGSKPQAALTIAKPAKQGQTAGKGTKTEQILALLRQPSGATLDSLMRATEWQAHSVRGFISGQLGKRMGLRVKSFRRDGERVYRLRG
jgi:Protein of unknown function (DUF3489)